MRRLEPARPRLREALHVPVAPEAQGGRIVGRWAEGRECRRFLRERGGRQQDAQLRPQGKMTEAASFQFFQLLGDGRRALSGR